MKNSIYFLIGILLSFNALAKELSFNFDDFNFSAPSVPNTSSLTNQQVGTIVYDQSSNQFKGLNALNNWDALSSSSGNIVTSGGTSDRIERASVDCSSGSCSIISNSAGIASVTRNASANYTITFSTGANTPYLVSAPTCTATSWNGTLYLGSESNTSVTVLGYNAGGGATDFKFNIHCIGDHN